MLQNHFHDCRLQRSDCRMLRASSFEQTRYARSPKLVSRSGQTSAIRPLTSATGLISREVYTLYNQTLASLHCGGRKMRGRENLFANVRRHQKAQNVVLGAIGLSEVTAESSQLLL